MAEVTGLRNNALPYPIYGQPWGVEFPILDNTGSLVSGAAGLDSEISKNGDTFGDATNEATEIASSSGMYYLLMIGSEMEADVVALIVKTSTTDAKTTPMVFYPRKLPLIRSQTVAGGAAFTITLDSGASALDDFYTGMVISAVIDGTTQVRIILGYTGSSKNAVVSPDFTTTPDSDDTYAIYLPEGVKVPTVNTIAWLSTTVATPTVAGVPEVDVTHIAGDAQSATDLKDFADAGYDPATNKVQGVVLTDTTTTLTNLPSIPAGWITAAGIATGAIDADALATDAVDEIVDGVWDEAVDGAVTARQSMRLGNSAAGAKLSGAATTNVIIRDLADTKNRVDAVVDASGNRTAVTRDLT